eukprot:15350852-Ditylum_brightwellii.AAC.1
MGVSMYGPNYKEWPSECLYNIDEVGIDIMKHCNKVISGKTCEGIFAVSSQGDGYYKDLNNDLEGTCPPFGVHADASTSTFLEDEQIRERRVGHNAEVLLIMISVMAWLLLHLKNLLEKITMKGKEIH